MKTISRILQLLFIGNLLISCTRSTGGNEFGVIKVHEKDKKVRNDVHLIRTDFSNETLWHSVVKQCKVQTIEGYHAYFLPVSDTTYSNKTPEEIAQLLPENYSYYFVLIADEQTFNNPEHSVLCLDLYENSMESFRVIPSKLHVVENNLSIANMDFYDFQQNCDENGIFRGL